MNSFSSNMQNSRLTSTRVLIVEDDEADYLYIRNLLSSHKSINYSAEWARDFDEGKKAATTNNYDVCFLDYRLGCRDGLELLESINTVIDFPVIVLTGGGSEEIDAAAMHAGASDYFDKRDVSATIIQRSIRYAIHNHQLKRDLSLMAHKDALTGLDNHRMFKEKLEDALLRANRDQIPMCLLFIDLNGFKQVNDEHGHPAGDAILKSTAALLSKQVRESDTLARYGGDEFVLLLGGERKVDALVVCNRILKAFESATHAADGKVVEVHISIGLATLDMAPENTVEELVKAADTALLSAKAAGKAQVVAFDEIETA